MSEPMDSYDRRILFELDCNSRRSLSEVSRKVRLGRDLVTYRIERLASAGILKRCTALINPYKLGYTVYKTYLKLEAQKDRWTQLVQCLDQHPATFWLAECYGKWDLAWCVLARTPKEAYDMHGEVFSDFRDIIPSYNVCTLVNNWWFPKKYLVGESAVEVQGWRFELPEFTLGTTPAQYTLDKVEAGIVRLLSRNSRLSTTEMADSLGSTPAVVKYRLEKLEQIGVIAGYRVDIDRSLLGMTLFNVQVQPRDYDVEKERAFQVYCKNHPQVLEYTQQLGDCKIEFVVEARDYAQFSRVMDEMREKFPAFIRGLDYLMIKRDYFHRTPARVFGEAGQEATLGQLERESGITLVAA